MVTRMTSGFPRSAFEGAEGPRGEARVAAALRSKSGRRRIEPPKDTGAAKCSGQALQPSRASPAQTRVSVPHDPAALEKLLMQDGLVWHRHSCLCCGKVQRLILLTHLCDFCPESR